MNIYEFDQSHKPIGHRANFNKLQWKGLIETIFSVHNTIVLKMTKEKKT